MGPHGDSWDCEAYGPDGRAAGALCFISILPGFRVCTSALQCAGTIAAERQRVFDRIRARAAEGDPVAVELARVFTDPSQLLGGTGTASDGGGA